MELHSKLFPFTHRAPCLTFSTMLQGSEWRAPPTGPVIDCNKKSKKFESAFFLGHIFSTYIRFLFYLKRTLTHIRGDLYNKQIFFFLKYCKDMALQTINLPSKFIIKRLKTVLCYLYRLLTFLSKTSKQNYFLTFMS